MGSLVGGAHPPFSQLQGRTAGPPWQPCPAGDTSPSSLPPVRLSICPVLALLSPRLGQARAVCAGTHQWAGRSWGQPGDQEVKRETEGAGRHRTDLRLGHASSAGRAILHHGSPSDGF